MIVSAPRTRAVARYTFLTAFGLLWIGIPFWFLIVNSLKSQGEASVLSIAWPHHWAAGSNYATVIQQGAYFQALANSLIIAVPTIVAVLLLGSLAAWVYARSKSRTLKFAYYASILSILLPGALIPTIYELTKIGLTGSREGYILTIVGTRLGIVIFLTTGFISALSPDIEHAALMDGASKLQIYRHMILPLISPVLFVGGVMLVISVWNEFFFALYLLPSSKATLPLTLWNFASASQYTLNWNLIFADVILTNLPLLILYVFVQRRVLAGLTEGALNG